MVTVPLNCLKTDMILMIQMLFLSFFDFSHPLKYKLDLQHDIYIGNVGVILMNTIPYHSGLHMILNLMPLYHELGMHDHVSSKHLLS
jgi:hypothetical protein